MVTGSSKAWLGGFGELANFQSVSDGKALVASAITDKGVQTAADATFQTMANNISRIESLDFDIFNMTFISQQNVSGPSSGFVTDTYTVSIPSNASIIMLTAQLRGHGNNTSALIIIPMGIFATQDTYYIFQNRGNQHGIFRMPLRDTAIANYASKFWIEGNTLYFTAMLTPDGFTCGFYR